MTITTITTPPDVPTLLTALRAKLTALGDVGDCRSATDVNQWRRTYEQLSTTISALQNPVDPQYEARLSYWREKRDQWLAKEAELETAIRERPDDLEPRRTLLMLQRGTLSRGWQETYGTLLALDAILVEMTEKRDHAQRVFDAAVQRAVALVAEVREVTTS